MMKLLFVSALLVLASSSNKTKLHCVGDCQKGDDRALMTSVMKLITESHIKCELRGECPRKLASISGSAVECTNGEAAGYPCENADLLSFVSLEDLGSGSKADGNDIWGWEDPETKKAYAITGQTDGTSFVDVTDPVNPIVVAFMPSNVNFNVNWRDMKTYKNYVYVVADDSINAHGLQVFDLTRLRDFYANTTWLKLNAPVTVKPDTIYKEFGKCHNIFINEDTGYLYCGGSRTCNSGPHIVDISTPGEPQFAGCYSDDGYTHDLECIVYDGPDTRYTNKEICFLYNEDTLTIVDVTQKSAIQQLSRTPYANAAYTHQGWCTKDRRHLLLDDELDEVRGKNDGHTETYIWNIDSLTNPKLIGSYRSSAIAVDHNLYIVDDYAFQTNYEAGLRVLDLTDIADGKLTEVAYFDVYPEADGLDFLGSWSNYPFYTSGQYDFVVVQSIDRGLFVIKVNLPTK